MNLLGDHWSPIQVLLVPLYRIWSSPAVLLLTQVALAASSMRPVYRFVVSRLGGPRPGLIVASGYALLWPLQRGLSFPYHEVAFAVPVLAFALEALYARRIRSAVLWACALLVIKEDLALALSAFGVLLVIRGHRRVGAGVAVGGVVAFGVITKVFIPAFGGGFAYWSYGTLGPGLLSAAWGVLTHPGDIVRTFFTPAVKRTSLLLILLPYGGLCLLSPIALLALPLLAERFLSDRASLWETTFHYDMVLTPHPDLRIR